MGGDTGRQLAQPKRLDHVVIGADLERDHGVDLVGPRAHHDHRHRAVFLPQLSADVESGRVGQCNLEKDETGPGGVDLLQAFGAVVGLENLVSVLRARGSHLAARRRVPIDDQHLPRPIRQL